MQDRYEYDILNYWNDQDDLYVNYIVRDKLLDIKANVIDYYNTSDLSVDYNTANPYQIEKSLLYLIKQNNGKELDLPKVSELSPLLKYVYDIVCSSESNMCHIDNNDWQELQEEYNYTLKDIDTLKAEIVKYGLDDYLTIDNGEYKIIGYGMLQTCFNDDREREIDYER